MTFSFLDVKIIFNNNQLAGPLLESKGTGTIFQNKDKENLGKNLQNFKIF